MASEGPDLRAHPRFPLLLQVDYPDHEGYLADATENLSASGAFVRTDRQLSVGDRLPMTLSFPGLLEPLTVIGEVMWVRSAREGLPAGIGVRIPADRAEDRDKLARVLDSTAERKVDLRGRAYRILLVEDNPHIMELYEYVMTKLARSDKVSIEVSVAKDGFDALERLAREGYDLVVTDLYMPVLDGFEFIRKLRADDRTRHVPVVAISAGGVDAQELAETAGANVFLRKPVRFMDVLETVKSLLGI
jgi:uncharacterized protein (TIGR02266 family)